MAHVGKILATSKAHLSTATIEAMEEGKVPALDTRDCRAYLVAVDAENGMLRQPHAFPGDLALVLKHAAENGFQAVIFDDDEHGLRIPGFPFWSESEAEFMLLDNKGFPPIG